MNFINKKLKKLLFIKKNIYINIKTRNYIFIANGTLLCS